MQGECVARSWTGWPAVVRICKLCARWRRCWSDAAKLLCVRCLERHIAADAKAVFEWSNHLLALFMECNEWLFEVWTPCRWHSTLHARTYMDMRCLTFEYTHVCWCVCGLFDNVVDLECHFTITPLHWVCLWGTTTWQRIHVHCLFRHWLSLLRIMVNDMDIVELVSSYTFLSPLSGPNWRCPVLWKATINQFQYCM